MAPSLLLPTPALLALLSKDFLNERAPGEVVCSKNGAGEDDKYLGDGEEDTCNADPDLLVSFESFLLSGNGFDNGIADVAVTFAVDGLLYPYP
jgi:hypothetical protein